SLHVMGILSNATPLLEQLSIDEAFLDVTDLPQPAETIARELQLKINSQVKLPCSLGVAANKLVAKIANNIGKAANKTGEAPNAIMVIPPGDEAAFLTPLPVQELWGVGPKTAARFEKLGIRTIGDLAKMPPERLVMQFGKMGGDLWQHARGIDERPVTPHHEAKSISQELTFEKDVTDFTRLDRTLRQLSEQIGYRLRQEHLCAFTVRIKLRWHDFSTLTRQITLPQPADQDGILYAAARQLFEHTWQPRRPVRLLGVGVSGLVAAYHQLSLWETPSDKEARLLEALDALRERYGRQVVRRGISPIRNKR
ncbi:MAG: DNA polymerase IV, partial [Anaerolineaceae bacterium]|nr:DNA polymerase IV [Anaerolineaceae bacterium]